jgi:hypothetical protein
VGKGEAGFEAGECEEVVDPPEKPLRLPAQDLE